MKLSRFYERAVYYGLKNDPRSKKDLNAEMRRARAEYKKLKGVEKKAFDKEKLTHPYADTRILSGDPATDIKSIFVGIDMETPELVLADRLRDKGMPIDLVLSHHPEGRALASLTEVMRIHRNILEKYGIGHDIAEELLKERIGEVGRSLTAVNHTRSVDAARILGIPYMCLHTPADNHVSTYLQKKIDRAKPKKVGEVLALLREIPEYKLGLERAAGPVLICGKEKGPAGKVVVDMTGGTEGPKQVFGRLHQAGVSTIVGMHFSETHYKNAKAEHMNLIIAGHITSDMLGLNLLFDNLEKEEKFRFIGCSGFERIKR